MGPIFWLASDPHPISIIQIHTKGRAATNHALTCKEDLKTVLNNSFLN